MPKGGPQLPCVAVLGLGAMGHAMGINLVRKDFWVVGYDISHEAAQRFADARGLIASTAQNAVIDAHVVLVMVSNEEQVWRVLLDSTGAVHKLRNNAVIIISSTVPPDYHRSITSQIQRQFERDDVQVLDCPVSGGVAGAEAGTLSIFSSGPTKAFNVAKPVLDALGGKICTIPGEIGSGSKAKMCHQVLPEIDIALCAEAMAFAARAGLNTDDVLQEVQASDGQSWIVGDRVKYAVEDGKTARSVIPNSLKDSVMILNAASKIGVTMPLVSIAMQVYKAAIGNGWECDDDSTLWRLYLHGYGDDAMHQQSFHPFPIAKNADVESQDIIDVFAGVHLAASVEAMILIHAIKLDADIMFDVISNAAGSNTQFVQSVPRMGKQAPFLRDVKGSKDVCERLRKAVAKANSIGASMPVASAALQLLLFDIDASRSEDKDMSGL